MKPRTMKTMPTRTTRRRADDEARPIRPRNRPNADLAV